MPDRLERSATNRVWTGVCGGIAEYFQVDAWMVRAFFVIATVFTAGLFAIVYVALVVIMPLPRRAAAGEQTPPSAPASESTQPLPPPPPDPQRAERRREAVGWLLVALGLVFLLGNMGVFRNVRWDWVWPLALIAAGIFVIVQRRQT